MGNIGVGAVLNFLKSLSPLEGQSTMGGVRCIFSLFFIFVLTHHSVIADNGRQGFKCRPQTDDSDKEECFSHFSDEMNPFMRLYHFLLVTAFILFTLWVTMIRYSSINLPKIARADASEKERLYDDFRKMFLLIVGSEAVVLSIIVGFFCYTQKILLEKTYNCILIAPVKPSVDVDRQEKAVDQHRPSRIILTCIDSYRQDKTFYNIVFIAGMVFILLLCIATVFQALCNKEKFIKELPVLNTTGNGTGKERLEILIPNH